MNGLGTLIGHDTFQVQHVPDRAVLDADAGPAEQIAAVARDLQRHAAVVPFAERELRGAQGFPLLESSELSGQQLRARELADHLGESQLYRLGVVQGPAEK